MAFYAKIGSYMGRCRDCGHSQPVLSGEAKHASPPRCNACGGLLDLGDPQLSRDAREQPKRRKQGHKRRQRTWK